jgi:hypothetical protein
MRTRPRHSDPKPAAGAFDTSAAGGPPAPAAAVTCADDRHSGFVSEPADWSPVKQGQDRWAPLPTERQPSPSRDTVRSGGALLLDG